MRTARLLALTAHVLVGSGFPATATSTATASGAGADTTTSAPSAAAPTAAAPTVWLCRLGTADDPCTPGLTTTRVSFTRGTVAVTRATVAARPTIDCFYVYPTVSDQKTPNADLTIDPQERSIAQYQAAQFSRVCKVHAPMYRQLTLANIGGAATRAQQALAYGDVLHAWHTYLRKYDHGRGVVLIGHSQGSFLLRAVITSQIDPKASARKLLVSALLLGGNVRVKRGTGIGHDFHHFGACRSATWTACVIAYSTYGTVPPSDSVFGRTTAPGLQVPCTNPAALGGGSGLLEPILPTQSFAPGSSIAAGIGLLHFTVPQVRTPWISAPGADTARCNRRRRQYAPHRTGHRGAPAPLQPHPQLRPPPGRREHRAGQRGRDRGPRVGRLPPIPLRAITSSGRGSRSTGTFHRTRPGRWYRRTCPPGCRSARRRHR